MFLIAECLLAAEYQAPQVLALMVETEADRMRGTLAELQAQVAGLVFVTQGVQRDQALDLTKKQPENALRLKAGL
ncbi:hypothetical protein D3C86_1975810 [compost metagenome]